jgi:enterochelin esterase-like enzyme
VEARGEHLCGVTPRRLRPHDARLSNTSADVKRGFKRGGNGPAPQYGRTVHVLAAAASVVALAGFSPLSTGPNGGQVLEGTIPGTPRASCVYLPPGYDPSRRYPVVYLLHGLPGSPTEYVFGTRIGTFADTGITAHRLKPFIAVMPPAGDTNRYGGEWAGAWEKELVDDVVPWVDANLAAVDAPSGRILAGLSAGGFGAVDIGLRNPGLFGTIESWSGYFKPLHDGPFKHAGRALLAANDPVTLARADAGELRQLGTRFYVSTGPLHSRRILPASSRAFATELRSLGLPVAYRTVPTLKREWRQQLDAGLTWALRPTASG